MKRLVLTLPEDKRREIKGWAGAEGVTVTRAMLMGFSLLKNGADGLIESLIQGREVDKKTREWADKVIQGVNR